MRRTVFKRSAWSSIRSVLASAFFTLLMLSAILFGLRQTELSSRAEGIRSLEEGIRRAAIQCYITEGRYPDSLEYVEQRYGVYIDRAMYIVHYQAFASNILPEITVLLRQQ